MKTLKERLLSILRGWDQRLHHRSHVIRGLAEQIEWRLAMVHSMSPDTRAAYNLSRELNRLLKAGPR